MSLRELKKEVRLHADTDCAAATARFFKTGKGEYGEGDVFLGLTVPVARKIAKRFSALPFSEIELLLEEKHHELRMIGLLILVSRFQKGDRKEREAVFQFYLDHRYAVNNWDLVDVTTPHIVGAYLLEQPKKEQAALLVALAQSTNLWERRMAVLATFPFIKNRDFELAIMVATLLLNDKEDLIHKAVGWMLREVGKLEEEVLTTFLDEHLSALPRTALRYAIERLAEAERKAYLKK